MTSPKALRLEVGKTYVTRDGLQRIAILSEEVPVIDKYPFCAQCVSVYGTPDGHSVWYTPSGGFAGAFGQGDHPWDLVAEVEAPPESAPPTPEAKAEGDSKEPTLGDALKVVFMAGFDAGREYGDYNPASDLRRIPNAEEAWAEFMAQKAGA